jgi:integrase
LHRILGDVLKRHDHARRGTHINSSQTGGPLSTSSWYQTTRALIDRAGIHARAPSHTFRKTVATVMYEQGVREHVIDQIMGWAPRTVRDRHYIRIAPKTMHDAILTLYQDDPICDPPGTPTEPPSPGATIAEDLHHELKRLIEIERLLQRQ